MTDPRPELELLLLAFASLCLLASLAIDVGARRGWFDEAPRD